MSATNYTSVARTGINIRYDDSASEPPVTTISNFELTSNNEGGKINITHSGTSSNKYLKINADEVNIGDTNGTGAGKLSAVALTLASSMGSSDIKGCFGTNVLLTTYNSNENFKIQDTTYNKELFKVDRMGNVSVNKGYDSTTSADGGGNLTVGGYITVNGSDYAENFEEAESCPMSRFVTLTKGKVRLAQPGDDYILGVTSTTASIVGDKDTEGVPVGLLGKLIVEDDGTVEADDWVMCGRDGIATKFKGSSTSKFMVMERVDYNHIRVIIK